MPSCLRWFTLHAWHTYQGPILNRQRHAARLHCAALVDMPEQGFFHQGLQVVSLPWWWTGQGVPTQRYANVCITEQDQWDRGSVMLWSGMHSHGRNWLNVQSYVDRVIQPEAVSYAQSDGLTFQRHNIFSFSNCLTQDFHKDQMQSIHCSSQHTHRPVPHRASARDLTDCQIGSCDPPLQTVVQLSQVIQHVCDDIPLARITHLIPSMPQSCRVVHEAHGLSYTLVLTLLHLTVCCMEQNTTINFCLANDDSWQIVDSTQSVKIICTLDT